YYQQTSAIFNLCPGTYSVTVTDHYNCTASSNYIVTQPAAITLNITTTSASCGQDNGSASATVTGGTQPYTYAWTSGSMQSVADSLAAGMYMLTVTDANGCVKFTLASISNNNGPVITVSSITNLTCYGSGNGAINITVSGGTFPYTFSWTTGATTEDISNLTEGPYEIEITDADACMTTASYFVSQPNQLNAVATTTPATCGNTNGAATITVTGGTHPYTYLWSMGGTNATQTGLAPGVYSVTVTDSHSCSANPVMVNINTSGGPVITVDSVIQTGCSGSDGAIYTSVSGGVLPYTYLWNNGVETWQATSLAPGVYSLTVIDANNCIAATSVEISGIIPPVPQICIVSVDTTEQKNLIVWEKEITTTIDHYNIYREGSWAGYYFLAGSVGYTQYSQFLDTNSNPQMRAYRYKITAVDQCGNESPASEPHKTIHLAINDGIGNSWNLIWTEYQGFYFLGYYIYRHTNSEGWTLIDSIATGYNSYTDWPPSMGQLYYRIGVFKNDTCYPSGDLKAQGGPYSQSFSNLDDNEIPVAIVSVNNTGYISVYPNPANNTVIIEGLQAGKIELMNIHGQVIKDMDITAPKTTIDISKLSGGVYITRIQTNDGIIMKKLLKQ
ncbi:MAG: T9SS type A sorting domain-containing protein, partial [Bacteroidia bacterium]|nr:T9SS type A sorting domain-containing protein [Bacteroidia bacterium]